MRPEYALHIRGTAHLQYCAAAHVHMSRRAAATDQKLAADVPRRGLTNSKAVWVSYQFDGNRARRMQAVP